MGESLFISYRRKDGLEVARLLRAELKLRGIDGFLDVNHNEPGPFDEALFARIEAADDFLLVLSPGALDRCGDPRDWLRREIAHAIVCRRNIVPVMMPGFEFPPAEQLPPELHALSSHNGISFSHEFFEAMVDKILSYLKTTPRRPEVPTSELPSPDACPSLSPDSLSGIWQASFSSGLSARVEFQPDRGAIWGILSDDAGVGWEFRGELRGGRLHGVATVGQEYGFAPVHIAGLVSPGFMQGTWQQANEQGTWSAVKTSGPLDGSYPISPTSLSGPS